MVSTAMRWNYATTRGVNPHSTSKIYKVERRGQNNVHDMSMTQEEEAEEDDDDDDDATHI